MEPWVVGLLRGAGLAVVGALIVFFASLTELDVPGYAYYAVPMVLFLLRELEAVFADQLQV